MKRLLALLVAGVSLHAATLQSIIDTALASNPSLDAIAQRIAALQSDIALADAFTNPQATFNVNDIQSAEPFRRDLEPMQTTSVVLMQKLPFFGKRDAQKQRVTATREALGASLLNARANLAAAIKKEAYAYWEHQTLYAITCQYETLAERNIELHQTYTATSPKSGHHMGIMSAELTLSELKIQKSAHLRAMQNALERLGYLAGSPVESLELELQMGQLQGSSRYLEGVSRNHALHAKAKEVDAAKAAVEEKALQRYPDPVIQAGYFYREAFEDYFSLGLTTELPLYGREKALEERERALMLSTGAQYADLGNALNAQVAMEYEKMKEAHTVYRVITEQSLPKIEHMFDLASASVQSGGDLFGYIEMVEKRLRLDTQRVRSLAAFHTAAASIEALTGGPQ